MRLIDADVLLEKVREIRKLALDRAVETPANMPFPIYQNPTYTRYSTQASEREKFKVMIEEAPTVQPERTCVNCGRTANNGGWYADGRTRCPIEEHYALPKDGFCHLWEKRNVTDDDYPERMKE